jgi:hypothetical protein
MRKELAQVESPQMRVIAETPKISRTYGGVMSKSELDRLVDVEREERHAGRNGEVLKSLNNGMVLSKRSVL